MKNSANGTQLTNTAAGDNPRIGSPVRHLRPQIRLLALKSPRQQAEKQKHKQTKAERVFSSED